MFIWCFLLRVINIIGIYSITRVYRLHGNACIADEHLKTMFDRSRELISSIKKIKQRYTTTLYVSKCLWMCIPLLVDDIHGCKLFPFSSLACEKCSARWIAIVRHLNTRISACGFSPSHPLHMDICYIESNIVLAICVYV